jgi:hypothetical protein
MIPSVRLWFWRVFLGVFAKVIQTEAGVLIIYGEKRKKLVIDD